MFTFLTFLLANINIQDTSIDNINNTDLNPNVAMISFDEGPTKNITKLISLASSYNIPLVFHLDPFQDNFSKEIIDFIHQNNMEVGIAITEELEDDETQIKKVFEKYKQAFINKTTYKPVLLRMPAIGKITEKSLKIAEDMNFVVNHVNLDSEDDQKSNIWPFICHHLKNSVLENKLSIVFRDRYLKSVDLLPNILYLLQQRNYKVVPAYEFYKINTNLIKGDIVMYKTSYKKKGDELIIKTVKGGVDKEVFDDDENVEKNVINGDKDNTEKNDKKNGNGDEVVKNIILPYNSLNKLKARELTKLNLQDFDELENAYETLFNEEESDTSENSSSSSTEEATFVAQENCCGDVLNYCFMAFFIIKYL